MADYGHISDHDLERLILGTMHRAGSPAEDPLDHF